jgi:hypothetical protein
MSTIKISEINGVVDTSLPTIQNINLLATASHSFFTDDLQAGTYKVIPNSTGSSVKSFDDSNIIGPIQIHSKGINEFYNKVTVEFPHKDLRNTMDAVSVTLPVADRYENEYSNELKIVMPLINDPVQAQYIASVELKQNRIDKLLRFTTDFTGNGLKAGDLIDLTNTMYQFTNKIFRIMEVEETDSDEGAIIFNIFALEYDPNIYSTSGLIRERREITEITARCTNDEIDQNELEKVEEDVVESLGGDEFIKEFAKRCPTIEGPSEVCEDTDIDLVITAPSDVCEAGAITVPYTITGVDANDIGIPLTGEFDLVSGTANFTIPVTANNDAIETLVFKAGPATHSTTIYPLIDDEGNIRSVTSNALTEGDTSYIVEGNSVVFTVNTENYDDGDTISYNITGNTAKVTSPLSGTLTITSDVTTLTVTTSDDGVWTEDSDSYAIAVAFTSELTTVSPCVIPDPIEIIVIRNATPDPNRCEYVTVPMVWCGLFDHASDYIFDVEVKKYAVLPVADVGGVAVPLTVSITDPGTASAAFSVDSTVNIATTSMGGAQIDIITTFAGPPSGGSTNITGVTTTFNGYW